MKIVYNILVYDEQESLINLLEQVIKFKRKEDDIYCVVDNTIEHKETEKIVKKYTEFVFYNKLNNDYAQQKNYLRNVAIGNYDYEFSVDADELVDENLLQILPQLLEENQNIDMFWISRINTVKGITPNDIISFGWQNLMNDKGWIGFPDWQGRLSRLTKDIYWTKSVHEVLTGFKTYSFLEQFPLLHNKFIEKQRKQNEKYKKIITKL